MGHYKFQTKLGLNEKSVFENQKKIKRTEKDEYSIKKELIKFKLREQLKKFKYR
jgi:hypothetical protein